MPDMDIGIGVALIAQIVDRKWLSHILDHYQLNNCSVDRNANMSRCCNIVRMVFGTVSDAASPELSNCTWDDQSRAFSNEIIAQWMNIANTGRPLSQWANYDPSMPMYFYLTPDRDFTSAIWKKNCSFFDEIEAEGVRETFGYSI